MLIAVNIQLNGIYRLGGENRFHEKWIMEFLEKITDYLNETIHDDYVVTFTKGNEKRATENQPQIVNVDK